MKNASCLRLLSLLCDRFVQKIPLRTINFNLPWWETLVTQKNRILVALTGEICSGVFGPLRIIALGFVIASKRLDYFIYLFAGWALLYGITLISRLYGALVQVSAVYSIQVSAYSFFLCVDPIYHAHRSSGVVLGKIERGARAYEDLLQAFFFDLVELPISIVTVLISLSFLDWRLALIEAALLLFIILFSTVLMNGVSTSKEKNFIKADDALKGSAVEAVNQVGLIRTVFASDHIDKILHQRARDALKQEMHVGFFFNTSMTIVKMLYLLSIVILAAHTFVLVTNAHLEPAQAIALIMGYIRGTYDIIKVEKPIRIFFRSLTRIRDLFAFVRSFGQQNYPVLADASSSSIVQAMKEQHLSKINISMEQVSFDYNENVKIFDHHSFYLDIPTTQKNKLYGIIGPSGIGKSTLLSMMGGQLKPSTGVIAINGYDIYSVNDQVRRHLIALQGQTATSVRGSLKYNMLFGLPDDQEIFTDNQLIKILEDVGLWKIFQSKEGLATFIGEGGLTLSGGQRQRLNFANLYLRATYFKPALILIDEPTSSLDEINEIAITQMIEQLAQQALTIVIAHRLSTIKQAVGILDCSLLVKERTLLFLSHAELLVNSSYYQRLMSGVEPIES